MLPNRAVCLLVLVASIVHGSRPGESDVGNGFGRRLRTTNIMDVDGGGKTSMSVMTFNVLRGTGPGSRPLAGRKAAMQGLLDRVSSQVDLFAFQEASTDVDAILAASLHGFARHPANDDKSIEDIEDILYFNPQRLAPVSTMSYQFANTRVHPHDRNGLTATRFLVGNTSFIAASVHLHYEGSPKPSEFRREEMETAIQKLKEKLHPGEHEPILIVGDFNEDTNPLVVASQQLGLQHSFQLANVHAPYTSPTMTKYMDEQGHMQLDWMLSRHLDVMHTERVDFSDENGEYPSDHFPIMTMYGLARNDISATMPSEVM